MDFSFDNSYARLPERFYSRLAPAPVSMPGLLCLNEPLAADLGLDCDCLRAAEGVGLLSGNQIPVGSEPLAMAYAGHQFGGWVPQLGDGRAILLGELIDKNGVRQDIQLKGSGRTPFSRGGDGRAWLGPVLREYIVSEAMAAFGIPTTRALAAVSTGETVHRERALPGAILTRVSASHVRVGTFEYFAARKDHDALKILADYVIDRHYPEALDSSNRYIALLQGVLARQARLIARWQGVGFIHGVMNTDNMSVAGVTIDYGPCAFMDAYEAAKVFSSIDQYGRYAYQNQPGIAQWNLAMLAQSLLPLFDADQNKAIEQAQAVIDSFPALYEAHYLNTMRDKLGLFTEQQGDLQLVTGLLDSMAKERADFTNTFRGLAEFFSDHRDGDSWHHRQGGENPLENREAAKRGTNPHPQPSLHSKSPLGMLELPESWLASWTQRLALEPMDNHSRRQRMMQANPAYIPRNHQIEIVIQAALNLDNQPLQSLRQVLSNPFVTQPEYSAYALPPTEKQCVHQTFCGT